MQNTLKPAWILDLLTKMGGGNTMGINWLVFEEKIGEKQT